MYSSELAGYGSYGIEIVFGKMQALRRACLRFCIPERYKYVKIDMKISNLWI